MKGSIFRTFFTLLLMFTLYLSFADAQNNKAINKSTSVNKAKTIVKSKTTSNPTTSNQPVNAAKPSSFTVPAKEQAILEEINLLRNNPQKYIEYLQDYRKLYKGNILYMPGEPAMETIEGTSVIDECIEFLRTTAKLPAYNLSKGLTQAANLQLKDLMEDSSIGHVGKDGSNLSHRLEKFGTVGNVFAENISYSAKTPRDIVLNMLIDDGIKSRSHRKNLLNTTFKIIGLGFGTGKDGQALCIVEFADSFREK